MLLGDRDMCNVLRIMKKRDGVDYLNVVVVILGGGDAGGAG